MIETILITIGMVVVWLMVSFYLLLLLVYRALDKLDKDTRIPRLLLKTRINKYE